MKVVYTCRVKTKKGSAASEYSPWNPEIFGAEEKTRTSTRIPPLDPEPSASTNSATSATDMNMLTGPDFVKSFFALDGKIKIVY